MQQSLSQYLAKQLLNGTRKHFSSLQADYLEEIRMSETTNNFTVKSQVEVGPVKQADHKAFEGANKGEHRAQAAPTVLPSNPAPRGETTEDESAGA